ncbi:MAG: hypothetical protein HY907_22680 [Deltaproteobacteria bacterium]|nr:hypothetical protein [Deltaproteobacteria bacterium]
MTNGCRSARWFHKVALLPCGVLAACPVEPTSPRSPPIPQDAAGPAEPSDAGDAAASGAPTGDEAVEPEADAAAGGEGTTEAPPEATRPFECTAEGVALGCDGDRHGAACEGRSVAGTATAPDRETAEAQAIAGCEAELQQVLRSGEWSSMEQQQSCAVTTCSGGPPQPPRPDSVCRTLARHARETCGGTPALFDWASEPGRSHAECEAMARRFLDEVVNGPAEGDEASRDAAAARRVRCRTFVP